MALSHVQPSVKNLDGAYTSSMRMGTATKFTPMRPSPGTPRQFAEYMGPATAQKAPGIPFARITTRLGSEI